MSSLAIRLVTLEKIAYSGEATRVSLPTTLGAITVLSGHEPTIGLLAPGSVHMTLPDGSTEEVIVTTGFFEVRPGSEIVILADSADRAGDIDREALMRSKDAAEAALRDVGPDINELELAHLEDVLAREIARLDVLDGRLDKR